MKIVLGLKVDPWHDTGAAIVMDDGRQLRVAAISEERLSRVKHSRAFPLQAIQYCLDTLGIRLEDVNLVVSDYIMTAGLDDYFPGIPLPPPGPKHAFFKRLESLGIPSLFAEHHLCHAASAFYCTDWDEATSLVIDGHGSKYETQSIYRCQGNTMEKVAASHRPGIGWMYCAVTEKLLGFEHLQDGKTMGLAGWAQDGGVYRDLFKGRPNSANPSEVDYPQFVDENGPWKLAAPAGLPARRKSDDPVAQPFAQYAYAAQSELESAVMRIVRETARLLPSKRLCYSGGVGLNILANRLILDSKLYDDFFIQPAASDAGIPLGAALYGYHCQLNGERRWKMTHAFLGREYSAAEMNGAVQNWAGSRTDAAVEKVAKLLANDYLIAWYQGGSEHGPRALGHRSILCLPRHPRMKDYLNREVKHREMFRPFAPIVPEEKLADYFDLRVPSPYMLINSTVRPDIAPSIPAVVHADGTARVESISRSQQADLHALLNKVGEFTGISVLLNTSLNLAGEPIVETPADAVDLFARSRLDALVVGPWLLTKVPLNKMLETPNPGLGAMEPASAAEIATPPTALINPATRIVVLDEDARHQELYGRVFQLLGVEPLPGNLKSPEEIMAANPDLILLSREWTTDWRLCAAAARRANIPVVYVMDGVIEWSYVWNNLSFIRPHGTMLQPMTASDLCVIGRHPARILASWGLGARIHVVGLPRYDHFDRTRVVDAAARPRILITTAKTYSHDLEQQVQVQRALRDLRTWFAANPAVEPVWRIAAGLTDELGVKLTMDGSLSDALREAAALITFPSTCALEGMLKGLPVAQVDYRPVPFYVASAWEIRSAEHIPNVIQELLYPPPPKLAFQDACLADELEIGDASSRLAEVIREALARIDRYEVTPAKKKKAGLGRLDYRQVYSELSAFAAAPAALIQYELDAAYATIKRLKTEKEARQQELLELAEGLGTADLDNLGRYSFVDHFAEGKLTAIAPGAANVGQLTHDRKLARAIFLHPPAQLSFHVPASVAGKLSFAVILHPDSWGKPDCGPCRFLIEADGRMLWETTVDPTHNPADRCWRRFDVAVPATNAGGHHIVFSTEGVGSTAYRWAFWRLPVFIWSLTDDQTAAPGDNAPAAPGQTAPENTSLKGIRALVVEESLVAIPAPAPMTEADLI